MLPDYTILLKMTTGSGCYGDSEDGRINGLAGRARVVKASSRPRGGTTATGTAVRGRPQPNCLVIYRPIHSGPVFIMLFTNMVTISVRSC